MGKSRNVYRILAGKPEGERPLGRYGCRWEDIIKMDFRETEWGGMDCTDLAHWKAFVNMVITPQVPYNVAKFLSS
jgi:hypothetical protein